MAKKVKLEKLAIEVNVLITAIVGDKLEVVMVKRAEAPLKGKLEILNTNVAKTESLDDAAKRLVKEVTGFKKVEIAQLGTYGDVKRKPDDRVISVAYIACLPKAYARWATTSFCVSRKSRPSRAWLRASASKACV